MLAIENGRFQYSKPIFKNVSLTFPDSLFVCVHGRSGCGKTTLLKLLSCELSFQDGIILYDGIEINETNKDDFLFNHVSYIDQDGSWLQNMNIKQHFNFYASLHGLNISDEIINHFLESVNLNNIDIKKYPDYLSVGQRKRFLIALALFVGKDIILLDEPTASLDQKNKEILLAVIKKIAVNHLVICSSHDSLLIESADITYRIEDYQVKADYDLSIDNQQEKHNVDVKKPQRIKYYKYKNFKLRFLYFIIFVLGAFATCFISYLISYNMLANIDLNKQVNLDENMGLVFYKNTDARWISSRSPDFIEESETEKLKGIEGVKEIVPYYALDYAGTDSGNDYFHISNDQGKNVDVSYYWPRYSKLYGRDWYANVAIFSYDSNQHIEVDGKEIDGAYIDEAFAELLGDNFKIGDQLSYDFFVPTEYTEEYSQASDMKEEARTYRVNGQTFPISFKVNGIMPENVYSDQYNSIDTANFIRIYLPVNQVQELLKQHAEKGYKHIYDHPMTYLILCENDMKSQVKIDIESMNELYHADYQGGNAGYVTVSDSQFNFILFLSGLVLVAGVILLILYFVSGRKKEIEILKREGLSHSLRKYYSLDFIRLMVTWLLLSSLSCYVYIQLLGVIPDIIYIVSVWMAISVFVIILMFLSFEIILSHIIKKDVKFSND